MVPLPQGIRPHLERPAVRATDASQSALWAVQLAAGADARSRSHSTGTTRLPGTPANGRPQMGLESELRSSTGVSTSVASAVAR